MHTHTHPLSQSILTFIGLEGIASTTAKGQFNRLARLGVRALYVNLECIYGVLHVYIYASSTVSSQIVKKDQTQTTTYSFRILIKFRLVFSGMCAGCICV